MSTLAPQFFHVTDATGRTFTVMITKDQPVIVLGDVKLPAGTYYLHALDSRLVQHGRFSVNVEHKPGLVIGTTPNTHRTEPEPDNTTPLAGGAYAFLDLLHSLECHADSLDGKPCRLCGQRHGLGEMPHITAYEWRVDFQRQLRFEIARSSLGILDHLARVTTPPESLAYFHFANHAEAHGAALRLRALNHWQSEQPKVKEPELLVKKLFDTPAEEVQPS